MLCVATFFFAYKAYIKRSNDSKYIEFNNRKNNPEIEPEIQKIPRSGYPPAETATIIRSKVQEVIDQKLYLTFKKKILLEMADYAGYNENYVSKVIKHEFGMEILVLVRKLRIRHFLDLVDKDITILDSRKMYRYATMCGYTTARAFSNAFKAETGLLPSDFFDRYIEDKRREKEENEGSRENPDEGIANNI